MWIIAISKAFQKIEFEVEQSEKDSPDAELIFEATNLTNKFSKDLDSLNVRIENMKQQFSVTPEGKLAREMRKISDKIKEEQELQIFKLPTVLVLEVNKKFLTIILVVYK